MKVSYTKKTVPKSATPKKNRAFQPNRIPKSKQQSAKRRTGVRVTAVPRRTLRGC